MSSPSKVTVPASARISRRPCSVPAWSCRTGLADQPERLAGAMSNDTSSTAWTCPTGRLTMPWPGSGNASRGSRPAPGVVVPRSAAGSGSAPLFTLPAGPLALRPASNGPRPRPRRTASPSEAPPSARPTCRVAAPAGRRWPATSCSTSGPPGSPVQALGRRRRRTAGGSCTRREVDQAGRRARGWA